MFKKLSCCLSCFIIVGVLSVQMQARPVRLTDDSSRSFPRGNSADFEGGGGEKKWGAKLQKKRDKVVNSDPLNEASKKKFERFSEREIKRFQKNFEQLSKALGNTNIASSGSLQGSVRNYLKNRKFVEYLQYNSSKAGTIKALCRNVVKKFKAGKNQKFRQDVLSEFYCTVGSFNQQRSWLKMLSNFKDISKSEASFYEKKLKNLDNEMRNVRAKCSNLKSKVSSLKSQIKSLESRIKKYSEKFKKFKKAYHKTKDVRYKKKYYNQVKILAKKLKRYQTGIFKKQCKLTEIEQDVKVFKAKLG